jgi:hypothetical protein
MGSALKAALDDLTKNLKKAPGWVPLSIACYLLFQLVPPNTQFLGIALHSHKEVVILLATLALYLLGDALDEALFDRLKLSSLDEPRAKVKQRLLMKKGYYEVAKALVVAAEKYHGTWIEVKNEAAKFLRSMGCLAAISAIVLLTQTQFLWSAVLLIFTPILISMYVILKAAHMRDIYFLVANELVRSIPSCSVQELPNRVRLLFWDGKLATSAPPAEHEERS